MKLFIIWIDREHAKVFEFSREAMVRKNFQAHRHDHHTAKRDNMVHQHEERHFFPQISDCLAEATSLLIIGPGMAKHHFRNYLAEHRPALMRKLIGCESVDHPTDNQIAAMAQRLLTPAGDGQIS